MSTHDGTVARRTVLGAGVLAGAAVVAGVPGPASARAASTQQVYEAKQRLTAQSYYCGTLDGRINALTTCAVLAYQKANHMAVDGILDYQVMTALKTAHTPPRFTTAGNAIEVDLHRQLVRVVHSGHVVVTLHATTGDGGESEVAGRQTLDLTPTGRFRLRPGTEPGNRTDSLGVQFRPHDFCVGGYAIYGRDDLAAVRKPSTHGGVAVHSSALLWLEQHGHLPAGRLVLVM